MFYLLFSNRIVVHRCQGNLSMDFVNLVIEVCTLVLMCLTLLICKFMKQPVIQVIQYFLYGTKERA